MFTYDMMEDMESHTEGGTDGGKDDVSKSQGGEGKGGKLVIIKWRTRSQSQIKQSEKQSPMARKDPGDDIANMEDETPQIVRKRRLVTKMKKVEKTKKGCADTDAPSSASVIETDTYGESPKYM